MKRFLAAKLLSATLSIYLAGCTSIESTHVDTKDDGSWWKTKKIRGFPITVDLPSAVEVRVVRRTYLTSDGEVVMVATRNGEPPQPLWEQYATFQINQKREVFFVDAARPAAGTLHLEAELDANTQYFKKLSTEVEDKTIETLTKAFSDLVDVSAKSASELAKIRKGKSTGTAAERKDWTALEHTVAVAYVDVHDPELLQKVQAFLDQYLNACTPPCPPPGGPGPLPVPPAVAPTVLPFPANAQRVAPQNR